MRSADIPPVKAYKGDRPWSHSSSKMPPDSVSDIHSLSLSRGVSIKWVILIEKSNAGYFIAKDDIMRLRFGKFHHKGDRISACYSVHTHSIYVEHHGLIAFSLIARFLSRKYFELRAVIWTGQHSKKALQLICGFLIALPRPEHLFQRKVRSKCRVFPVRISYR